MNDKRSTLPGRRVIKDGAGVANGERMPGRLAIWDRIDELQEMVVVVKYGGVVIAVDLVLLAQDTKKGVDVVYGGLCLLKFELTELKRRFVVERGPVWR